MKLPTGVNASVSATDAVVALEQVPAADTVSGTPVQGIEVLGMVGSTELGLWELRGGAVTDTEVDECFVVISGAATIEFLDEPDVQGRPRAVEVRAGDVMRLVAGSRTRWSVADHIRKVYLTEA